jgi:uncharacterized protein
MYVQRSTEYRDFRKVELEVDCSVVYQEPYVLGWIVREHINDPLLFDELARRYPKATFILGHAGGAPRGFEHSIRVAQNHSNVYLEVCSTLGFTSFWLKKIVDAVGDERVFYGSDMPLYDPRAALGIVLFAKIPDKTKERVLGRNIEALLKSNPKGRSA